MNKLSEEVEAAYRFVDRMVEKADDYNGNAPLWHGWALREAFLGGIKWREKEKNYDKTKRKQSD